MSFSNFYSKQKLVAVEKKIRTAIKEVTSKGVKLTDGGWHINLVSKRKVIYPPVAERNVYWETEEECCPLEAVCLVFQPKPKVILVNLDQTKILSAASELKVSYQFVSGFITGFDGGSISGMNRIRTVWVQGFEMGQKLRKEFKP